MSMTFDYVPVVVAAADDGEPLMLFRPEIVVMVHRPAGVRTVRALVDTGSDYTIFPLEVATRMGIPTLPAEGPPIKAFGGQAIGVRYADVPVQIDSTEETLLWTARVFFTDDSDDSSSDRTAVVGHMGFLEFLTATFRGDTNTLDIDANEDLPRSN
jgi:hypothetical protein